MTFEQAIFWVAVAAVSVVSAARITRAITYDAFPPAEWFRNKVADKLGGTRWVKWSLLFFCGYCFGFWAYGAVLLAGYLSDWHLAWWLVNSWFAGGYLAAIVMAHDGEDGED